MATSKKLETIYHDGQPDRICFVFRHLSVVNIPPVERVILFSAVQQTAGLNGRTPKEKHWMNFIANPNEVRFLGQIKD